MPDVIVENQICYPGVRSKSLLGCYYPMKSPGRIILFGDNLRRFYWALIAYTLNHVHYLHILDLECGWEIVRLKTYNHELFHYYCDVCRSITNSTYKDLLEESLASAWSRQCANKLRSDGRNKIAKMNSPAYNVFIDKAYKYTSPGYRDWTLYADPERFNMAFMDYISPVGSALLRGNGVDLETPIVNCLTNISGGFEVFVEYNFY